MTRAGESHAESPLVLIAEDQRIVRASAARHLRRLGFRVLEADDGKIALDLAQSQDFEIAIVDLGLPRVSGFEIVAALKERLGSHVSVLVMSGSIDNATKVRAFDAGADDFVCKPAYMPELVRRVQAFRRTQLAIHEAEQSRQRVEQLNLYASEAAALLAHDLSNGLAVALGNLDFLQHTAEDRDPEQTEARDSTIRALRKMSGLVRNFVELRRLEDAALVPEPTDLSIAELLHGVAGLHRHEVQPKGARIEVDCPDSLDVVADPVLVERVVHNLVGNAIRYVNEGGRVKVSASLAGEDLVLTIGNSGEGIAPEKLPKLFEKYWTTGERKARTGMGLYFCRLAAEAHGGTISVEPTAEMPATFVVRIPGAAASQNESRAASAASAAS